MIEITFDRPIRKLNIDFPVFVEGQPAFNEDGKLMPNVDGGTRTVYVREEDVDKARQHWAIAIVDNQRV